MKLKEAPAMGRRRKGMLELDLNSDPCNPSLRFHTTSLPNHFSPTPTPGLESLSAAAM